MAISKVWYGAMIMVRAFYKLVVWVTCSFENCCFHPGILVCYCFGRTGQDLGAIQRVIKKVEDLGLVRRIVLQGLSIFFRFEKWAFTSIKAGDEAAFTVGI